MICFDMDGVLAVYNRADYKLDNNGIVPFLSEGHYKKCEPDTTALQVFWRCVKMCPNDTYIITSIPEYEHSLDMIFDKMYWLNEQRPEEIKFDFGTKFLAPTSTKMSHIEFIRGSSLTRNDILIDDWNPNLYAWAARGGRSIKYINGQNSESSFHGIKVRRSDSADQIFDTIMRQII